MMMVERKHGAIERYGLGAHIKYQWLGTKKLDRTNYQNTPWLTRFSHLSKRRTNHLHWLGPLAYPSLRPWPSVDCILVSETSTSSWVVDYKMLWAAVRWKPDERLCGSHISAQRTSSAQLFGAKSIWASPIWCSWESDYMRIVVVRASSSAWYHWSNSVCICYDYRCLPFMESHAVLCDQIKRRKSD